MLDLYQTLSKSAKGFGLVIVLILLAAFLVRFYGLGQEVFWLDEIMSVKLADQSPISRLITQVLVNDGTPPLYHLLLKMWRLPCRSPEWTRLFSLIASVACVGAMGILAAMLGGKRLAALSMLLMTVSQYQVYYAQEARVYAWLMLTSVLSWTFLFAASSSPHRKALWTGYVLTTLVGIYLHYVFWFAVLAQMAWVGFHCVTSRQFLIERRRPLLTVLCSGLLASTPMFWFLLKQYNNGCTNWIPPMNLSNAWAIVGSMASGISIPTKPWLVWAAILLAMVGWFRFAVSSEWKSLPTSLILAATLLTTGIMISISTLRPVVLHGTRFLSITQPFFVLAIAAGYLKLRPKLATLGLAAICCLWVFADVNAYRCIHKRRYDVAARFVVDEALENDRVIIAPAYSYECLLFFEPKIPSALDLPQEQWALELPQQINAGTRIWVLSVSPVQLYQEKILGQHAQRVLTVRVSQGPYLRIARYEKQ